jgi:hypothetical protein
VIIGGIRLPLRDGRCKDFPYVIKFIGDGTDLLNASVGFGDGQIAA